MKIKYRSNHNVSYACTYHVVWCPKYRRKVLIEAVAEQLEQIIREVCQEQQAEVLNLEVMPDHVHLLVGCDPQFGIHRLVKLIKGRSSRRLRQEFPPLTTRMPTLWTNSSFVATVGGAPLSVMKQYIENQSMSKQAYKFRLYPTKKQAQALQWTLERARELYNAALQERRDAYRMVGKSITYPRSPFLPSDGGFRRRKLPEKPRRGFSPGESSLYYL